MNEQQKKSFITLVQLDAERLFRNIVDKKEDYLMILNFKRTREHFYDIFHSKYAQVSIDNLKELKESTIHVVDSFYREIEELRWYLLHTEDLPAMVSDHTHTEIKKITGLFQDMCEHLNAELNTSPAID